MKSRVFFTVKSYIDALDPCGLLAGGAPKDEYDLESGEISQRISMNCSTQNIAKLMAQVFEKYFDQLYDPSYFLDAASHIKRELPQK